MAPMAVRTVAAAQTQELGSWSGRVVGWRWRASAAFQPAARHRRTPMMRCDAAAAEQEPSVPGIRPITWMRWGIRPLAA
ncbi:hypothetical protein ACQP2U_18870 [Nocardia sp. CA-084685]|uniref:hypothetical protein n=1 Tax=Nocardia sp. CA-084685 TaxID=3239970 RepID=UPI003D96678C